MSYFNDIKAVADSSIPWEELNASNILVTGATGLIGSCIVDVLMSRDSKSFNLYVVGRNEDRAHLLFDKYVDDKNFHFIKHDITNPFVFDLDFNYIIDAASNASPNFFLNNPVGVMKSNLLGVINLLEYGVAHKLKKFLFVSTGEVYGQGDSRVFDESYSGFVDSMSPRSCYPSSKRAAETLCASYAQQFGIDFSVARLSHTYGPHFTESDNRVYAQFLRNALKGEDIILKSTGSTYRSWCYVVDSVSALFYILLNGKSGEAYNVADATSNISIKELAELIASIAGKKVILQIPTAEEMKQQSPISKAVFNTKKLESLGWSIKGNMKAKMTSVFEECRRLEYEI